MGGNLEHDRGAEAAGGARRHAGEAAAAPAELARGLEDLAAPVAAKGCPIAIDPPHTLKRSQSIVPVASSRPRFACAQVRDSSACVTARIWAANASWRSRSARSENRTPARASALGIAWAGPISSAPRGSTAVNAWLLTNASGARPSARARSSRISRSAPAPSVKGELLPAVIVPCGSNTGGSFASAARSIFRRTRLSCETDVWYPGGAKTVITSPARRPSSHAAAARRWLRSAYSSCAARVIAKSCAMRSACSPIVRPVERSRRAGGCGTRSRADSSPSARMRSRRPRARSSRSIAWARFFDAANGTSETQSAPPAMPHAMSPAAIACATSIVVW